MKKNLSTLLAAAALTAAALGFAGTAAATPAPDTAGTVNLCDQVDDAGMCQFHASGVFSDIDLVFPSDYPDQQAIQDYLNTVVDQYQQDSGPDLPTSPHALEVNGTRFQTAGTQSVVLDVYQNVGGAHPSEWFKAFNYDTATRAPITFDTVFRPGSAATLLPLVQADLSRQFGQQVTIDADTGADVASYQNFALTDDAVIFYFDRSQLVPATPATEVSVPRSAIAGLLNAGF